MSLDTQVNGMASQIVSCVKEILQTEEPISRDTDLFLLGLDSITAVDLIVNLESMFGIAFEDDELIVENFSTVEKIMAHVSAKAGGSL